MHCISTRYRKRLSGRVKKSKEQSRKNKLIGKYLIFVCVKKVVTPVTTKVVQERKKERKKEGECVVCPDRKGPQV